MNEYNIGDVANGHVLTAQGWMPTEQAVAPPPHAAGAARMKNTTAALIAGAVIGAILLFGLAFNAQELPNGNTIAEEMATQSTSWTADSLASSIDNDSINALTGEPMNIEDVACSASPDVVKGVGFWLCSYRSLGEPQTSMRTVETTEDSWQQGAVFYTEDYEAVTASAAGLSIDEINYYMSLAAR